MITLNVNDQELELLIAGMGELPAKMGFNLIGKLVRIRAESAAQNPASAPAVPLDSSPETSSDRA